MQYVEKSTKSSNANFSQQIQVIKANIKCFYVNFQRKTFSKLSSKARPSYFVGLRARPTLF